MLLDELCITVIAGFAGKRIVVFMHNLPSGRERSMRPAGMNNTDPGQWQCFVQHCHRVVNMTFDETRWQWHEVNQNAAQGIIAAVKDVAKESGSRYQSGSSLQPHDFQVSN